MYSIYGFDEVFQSNNLYNYNCYNETVDGNKVVIGGNFGGDFYGVLSINIYKCINKTNSVICKTKEEIDNALNGAWFELFIIDHFIDVNDYNNPVKTFSNSIYSQLDQSFSKTLMASFSHLKVDTDNGFLFDSIVSYSSYKYEQTSYDMRNVNYQQTLVEFVILSGKAEEYFYRSYIKIQSVFAEVGGILNGLSIIGIIMFKFFEGKLYENSLVNSLFVFKFTKTSDIKRVNNLRTEVNTMNNNINFSNEKDNVMYLKENNKNIENKCYNETL